MTRAAYSKVHRGETTDQNLAKARDDWVQVAKKITSSNTITCICDVATPYPISYGLTKYGTK